MASSALLVCWAWLRTAVVFCVVTIAAKLCLTIRKQRDMLGDMPVYPGSLPIVGHAYLTTKFTYSSLINEIVTLYNKNISSLHFYLGPLTCGYVSSPDDIEQILGRKETLGKGKLFTFFHAHSSGLLNCSPPRWNDMRKLAGIPLGHKQLMNSFHGVFQKHTNTLLDILEQFEGQTVNVYPFLSRCAQDITFGSHFGVDFNVQHNTDLSCVDTVPSVISLVFERMMKFWLYPDFIYFLTEKGQSMKKCVDHHRRIACKVIDERRRLLVGEEAQRQEGQVQLPDRLLDVLFMKGLPDEDIEHEIMDVILVGFEGISTVESWILLLLAMFPDHQERVQGELDQLAELSLESLQQCQYLDMVTKEALRLFGIAIVIREMDSDVPIAGGAYTLPAGSEMIIGMTLVHRDPRHWEHPNSFYPDHFQHEKVSARPKHAFLPFGAGPRKCPAYGYGMLMIKFAAASLLRKYTFSTDLRFDKLDLHLHFMYKPKLGFLLNYERR